MTGRRLATYACINGVVAIAFAIGCGNGSTAGPGSAGASGSAGTAGVVGTGGDAGNTGAGGVGGSAGAPGGAGGSVGAGGAGAPGSAGAGGSANGGSAGNAAGASGSGGAAGMTDGGGDTGIANGCATSTPPTSALISDFATADAGVAVIASGAMVTSGFSSATSKVESGAWRVAGHTSVNGDSRVTLVFNTCVDARGYDGITFSVTGLEVTCFLSFLMVDAAHAPAGGLFPNASGPADAKPHGYRFDLPDAIESAMTFRFPFNQPGSGGFGGVPPNPTTLTDPAKLVALQWIFSGIVIESCDLDLTIDDLRFYRDEADGGSDGRD